MKKLITIAVTVALIACAFSSCKSSNVSVRSEMDSVAYSIGVDLGNYIKNLDSTLNLDIISGAIRDVINNREKISQDDAFAFLREYFMVRVPARAKAEGEEFLAGIERENRNIQKTESGLLYEVLEPGDPNVRAVEDRDKVRVVYEGTLKDGKVFDSSIERGDTAEFALNRVIKGWTEGMKLVGKGGHIKLYIPSEMGYGERGNPNIGPNEPLVFDVRIIDVIPDETAE